MVTRERYLWTVQILVRSDGERLPLVLDANGVPAHYPTCLILSKRSRSLASASLRAVATDLVHLGQCAIRMGIDQNERLENGELIDLSEVSELAELCGVTTTALRRLNSTTVAEIRRGAGFSRSDGVINATKNRRIATAIEYINLIARIGEAQVPAADRRSLSNARKKMITLLREHKVKMRSSRIRAAFSEVE
ncbi:hypothetical protein [Pseudovibrio sp. Ad26]|nr:hypothetical protein [Pseudovibrio sp. Ad26]KZL13478.1 hypothetical protein PsAD26_02249 [Pseudovibrio sp. Ad26]